jgi:flagellar biosynthesis/type III secretory pathway protein FliH
MLIIKNEGLQIIPGSKVLKASEYMAFIAINEAIEKTNAINAEVISQANAESDRLIAGANARAGEVVNEANARSDTLIAETNEKARVLIEEANAKAKKIIDDAVLQQAEILASAKTRYEEEARKGHDDGYASGKKELTEQMMEMVTKNTDNFAKFEKEIVGIVSKAVRRIIGEIDQNDLITNVVKTAVKISKIRNKPCCKYLLRRPKP